MTDDVGNGSRLDRLYVQERAWTNIIVWY